MYTKRDIVKTILQKRSNTPRAAGHAFAPVNIALCKYWGKRDSELNLPITSSLSLTLGCKGALMHIVPQTVKHDSLFVNGMLVAENSKFARRLVRYLDLFRPAQDCHYKIETTLNVPLAAGLASSACVCAVLVRALDDLYAWQLSAPELSILARLGSGSACRSLWNGFVEWHAGVADDGMDSHGKPLTVHWPELRVGMHIVDARAKPLSSRAAMQRTVETSALYQEWPTRVDNDLQVLKHALESEDFALLGKTAEANALAMHATMEQATPPVIYSQADTYAAMEKVQKLRASGVPVYFTQDAGPNLKLLFLANAASEVAAEFPHMEVLAPFADLSQDQVVLVDSNDISLGISDKLLAHQQGKLHRAFSIIIMRKVNGQQEVLLQQRQQGKYHSSGLWSNSCCSHPRPGEDLLTAAHRRLQEEMGFDLALYPVGNFKYHAELDNGLIENELDHVLVGMAADKIDVKINPEEVAAYRWMNLEQLYADIVNNPGQYSAWLQQALLLANQASLPF